MDDLSAPASLVGITGSSTFTVDRGETTNAFGVQKSPPGKPAAGDSEPAESVRVLGTAPLLSHVEFTGRDSMHGAIPDGTGVVGKRASVTHRDAVTVGEPVRVTTEVVDVDGRDISYEGSVETVDDDRAVGEATVVVRLVEREQFLRAVDGKRTEK
ncbi:thioesterase family protein [Halobacteriales archaeon Cl-PHB]